MTKTPTKVWILVVKRMTTQCVGWLGLLDDFSKKGGSRFINSVIKRNWVVTWQAGLLVLHFDTLARNGHIYK
jgi:hypothetical protein